MTPEEWLPKNVMSPAWNDAVEFACRAQIGQENSYYRALWCAGYLLGPPELVAYIGAPVGVPCDPIIAREFWAWGVRMKVGEL